MQHIITGENVEQACKDVEVRLALLTKPKLFFGKKSVEISYDKEFESMCLVLSHNIQVNPYKMTVLQFYNAFEYLKKLAESNKRAAKAIRKKH